MPIPENDTQLWSGFKGHGLYAKRAERDREGNEISQTYATKDAMTGATEQSDGVAGLVPAPLIADKDKFLKGDGTWAAPPDVNLSAYYYDKNGNGLSARRTSGVQPYGSTSLVGSSGNLNSYDMDANFYLDWGGTARSLFNVSTRDSGLSYIGFGSDPSNVASRRYLLPKPEGGKYAKANAEGKIVWNSVNEVPSSTSSDSGKVLKVNQSGSAEWAEAGSGLPDPTESNSLLLGQSDGSKAWNALSRDVIGTPLLDESNRPILDENSNPVYDANSTTDLWTSFAGHEFGAKRAYADQEGNNIKATYARKEVLDDLASALDTINDTLESVSHGGMYDLGDNTESDLINGKLAIGCGNSTTTLTLTTVNAVTILANNGVPNFALLIDNSGNSNAVIVTVKDSTDTTTLLQSVSAGNEVTAGKIYQLTCVGNCWTLVEFETPSA